MSMRPLEALYRVPAAAARHRATPYGEWLDGFVTYLRSKEFGRTAVRASVCYLYPFGRWLQAQGLPLQALTEEALAAYGQAWDEAYRHRHGRAPARGTWLLATRCVRELMHYGRQAGLLPSAVEPPSSLPIEVVDYLDFCRTHRGLSRHSLEHTRHYLARLASFCGAQGTLGMVGIPLAVLDGFLAHLGQEMKRESLHGVTGIIRGYLRYLFLAGAEPEDRSRWLEYPSVFRQMRLPRHLSDAQLAAVLERVDRATPSGKRDWAVLMLLVGYGLRIGEVALLRLMDIDFAGASLHVRRVKGGGEQTLPLTGAVAEALRDYIEHVRPRSAHGEVFLTFRHPIRPYRDGFALSTVCVRKYLRDCDLPAHGAHVFRHTTARRLRQGGAPLGVVRQVLGHRSTETTNRYLRIALEELREVADNYAELL